MGKASEFASKMVARLQAKECLLRQRPQQTTLQNEVSESDATVNQKGSAVHPSEMTGLALLWPLAKIVGCRGISAQRLC